MKCSISWLREWVDPKISNEALCDKLTMGGFEVESLEQDGNDFVVDVSITPNRGDCLSVRGLAREVAAITGAALNDAVESKNVASQGLVLGFSRDEIKVTLEDEAACPYYLGRIIRGVKADATTPEYICERLRKAGVRVISPVVDVTNYVMLELGQPMHAFDLATVDTEIRVRRSKKGEKISLLDATEKTLDGETLIIADKQKPLAIAGVMGGMDSSVTLMTKDILLESAWFAPQVVARQRQFYNLNSDSAARFERGVDYTIQREAIKRATQLILEICGGQAGDIVEAVAKKHLPKPVVIDFPHSLIKEMLGIEVSHPELAKILKKINPGKIKEVAGTVAALPIPPYRFDLTIPEDIVEEVARLHGYDKIPTHSITAKLESNVAGQSAEVMAEIRQRLVSDGFHEIISYSFVDKKRQKLLDPDVTPRELVNPITADMEVMRTNLWPGLLDALLYNKSRQQNRIRIFESGLSFIPQHNEIQQEQCLAGLMSGLNMPEQWGQPKREADFYDLKGVVERVLAISFNPRDISWKPEVHPALHPGQSASIYYQDKKIGVLGALSPIVIQALDVKDQSKILLFELNLTPLLVSKQPRAMEVSKFPEIRRDIALLLNNTVPALAIQDTIRSVAGDWLKDVFIFDVYQGKGISPGKKSVALGLILQHPTRTLVDDEVNALMERVTAALKGQLGAELRS